MSHAIIGLSEFKASTVADHDHSNQGGGVVGKGLMKPSIVSIVLFRKAGIRLVQKPDDRVLLDVLVDSGACVTVVPASICMGIGFVQNAFSRDGLEYEVAGVQTIQHFWEEVRSRDLGQHCAQTDDFPIHRRPQAVAFELKHAPTWGITAFRARKAAASGMESQARSSHWRGWAACTS